MKILFIGASQGTGALALRAALEKGHSVTAFARSPQKLLVEHAQLEKVVEATSTKPLRSRRRCRGTTPSS